MKSGDSYVIKFIEEWRSLTGEAITEGKANVMMLELASYVSLLDRIDRGFRQREPQNPLASAAENATMAGLRSPGGGDGS